MIHPTNPTTPAGDQPLEPMNRSLALLALSAVLLTVPVAPRAQVAEEGNTLLYVGTRRPPVQVTTGAVYQRYEDDDVDLAQLVVPFTAFVPVMPDVGLSVRAWYASADGSEIASLSGIADAQVALSYHRAVGTGSVVGSLSVNLPSGDAAMAAEEVETAFLIGQGFYDFHVPTLGQGFNVAPGLTYAFPVGERLALGAGASYQYRGSFEPRSDVDDAYDPGDELLLTAGLDYRLAEASTLALDASYVHYGDDAFGDLTYTPGDAFAVTAQWTGAAGAHEVRVLGRARHRTDSTIPPETAALLGLDAAIPTQARLLGHVRFGLGPRFHLGALAQGRYYAESEVFAEKTLFDVGVVPEYEVYPGLTLNARLGATLGDLQGVEAGAGLAWGL
jgi:hypothetical protein